MAGKLPPFGRRVLVLIPYSATGTGVGIARRVERPAYGPGPVWELDSGVTVTPTHWLPLPPAEDFKVLGNTLARKEAP